MNTEGCAPAAKLKGRCPRGLGDFPRLMFCTQAAIRFAGATVQPALWRKFPHLARASTRSKRRGEDIAAVAKLGGKTDKAGFVSPVRDFSPDQPDHARLCRHAECSRAGGRAASSRRRISITDDSFFYILPVDRSG